MYLSISMMSTISSVRGVVVGDAGVGKSCFVISWSSNSFPKPYLPMVRDNYVRNVTVCDRSIEVQLLDTGGKEDYDRLRPLSYPCADFFLVCFAVSSPTSLANVQSKWVPEVQHYRPGTPMILLGLKGDLRFSGYYASTSDDVQPGSEEEALQVVDLAAAEQMARDIGAVGYYEMSALTRNGMSDAVLAAVRSALAAKHSTPSHRKLTWPFKRHTKSKGASAPPDTTPPPELPPKEKTPLISIPSSKLSEDWAKLINDPNQSDVVFKLDMQTFFAHRYVLCCTSELFRRVFGITRATESLCAQKSLPECPSWNVHQIESVSVANINAGLVEGFISIQETAFDISCRNKTEITLDSTKLTDLSFKRCLEFLYTGCVDLKKDSEGLEDTLRAARLFNLPELQQIVENAQKGDELLNPSIGTWLNDRNCAIAKELFFNKPLFSDVTFKAEGTLVHSHKLVLCTRCDVMSSMLTGGSQINTVEISKIELKTFLAFLEYLYTDHSPIEDSDSIGILELANQYVMPRLTALCELYISKHVERATSESIAQADVDIIGLLLTSQLHNASQLSAWCLHFVSSNYVVFKDKEEFSELTGDNMDYINQHRWPPLSYEQAMEEYRKKYPNKESDEAAAEDGVCEGEGGGEEDSNTEKGRTSNTCRIM